MPTKNSAALGHNAMRHFIALTILIALFAGCRAMPAQADVIIDWNTKADEIAAQKQTPPVDHSRGLAMLHVAMFEAVNAIQPKYAPYKLALTADPGLSKEAAAAAAGHAVLLALFPDQKANLDATLAAMLVAVPDGDAKAKAVDLGKAAATGIIALRANDGIDAPEAYRPVTSPGVYVPTVVPILQSAAKLRPWVMSATDQMRPGPPAALDSETWTRDLNEIRELGSRDSGKRTAEQTTIGRFWFQVGARTYNPIVRQVAANKRLDLIDCARLFALVAMAGTDAQIAVFDAKYHYNLWRPITAIRNADRTGNPATPREASWRPLGDTPMHPEYPCAHCITSSTVATVIEAVVGRDVGTISLTSPTAPGVTRSWSKLEDYTAEVSMARIYAGFHYRFSAEVAQDMGKKIGAMAVATVLRPK